MEKTKALLAAGKPVRCGEWDGPQVETIREKLPNLITTKPIVCAYSVLRAGTLWRSLRSVRSGSRRRRGGGVEWLTCVSLPRFARACQRTRMLSCVRRPLRRMWPPPARRSGTVTCRHRLPPPAPTPDLVANHFRLLFFPLSYVLPDMVNLSAADFARKRNKHLAGIAAWVAAHGGGSVIPFSIEWEQQLWALRADPAGRDLFLAAGVPAGAPPLKSALPRAILTSYKVRGHVFAAGGDSVCSRVATAPSVTRCVGRVNLDYLPQCTSDAPPWPPHTTPHSCRSWSWSTTLQRETRRCVAEGVRFVATCSIGGGEPLDGRRRCTRHVLIPIDRVWTPTSLFDRRCELRTGAAT